MSQPAPVPGGPEILPMVIEDLRERGRKGLAVYGMPLTAHNGRDALRDGYEEVLDLACYIKQEMIERESESTYLIDTVKRLRAEVRYWKQRAEQAERSQ